MIIAKFEPVDDASPRSIKFRGKDALFWQHELFKSVQTYSSGMEFDVIIFFDPLWFSPVSDEGIEAMKCFVAESDLTRESIYAPVNQPFYLVTASALNQHGFTLAPGEDILSFLRDVADTEEIEFEPPFPILDVQSEWKEIEDAVIRYQVREYVARGVIFEDFGHFFIEGMVPISEGTVIGSGVVIRGDCHIGRNVKIHPHVVLENVRIGDNSVILPGCIVSDSVLEEHVQIGPYTHLRNGALVKQGAKMGNFVEMKKSILGEGSKSMHLTYIGDAQVGKNVNIGAGTITCNYDGVNKNKTIIEDGVFIGSGTELVAPVTIHKNSYVAAGSTITEDVPGDSLGVGRGRQRNVIGWVSRKRKKVCQS